MEMLCSGSKQDVSVAVYTECDTHLLSAQL